MPFSRKTEDERAAAAAQKEERQRQEKERKRLEAIERARAAFFATPAGEARTAFERGDHLFQYSFNVMNQKAVIVAMVGSTTTKQTADPTDVLNSVCHEGWELVNGSFVFIEEGQQSRDKFMSSGQNVATKGAVVGYYLFKRNEENRRTPPATPWLVTESAVAALPESAVEVHNRIDAEREEPVPSPPLELTPPPAGPEQPEVPGGSAPPLSPPPPVAATAAPRRDGRRRAAVLASAGGLAAVPST